MKCLQTIMLSLSPAFYKPNINYDHCLLFSRLHGIVYNIIITTKISIQPGYSLLFLNLKLSNIRKFIKVTPNFRYFPWQILFWCVINLLIFILTVVVLFVIHVSIYNTFLTIRLWYMGQYKNILLYWCTCIAIIDFVRQLTPGKLKPHVVNLCMGMNIISSLTRQNDP